MDELKKGMVVQLKSGGPKMTITEIEPKHAYSITCNWFLEGKLQSSSFTPKSLTVIEEDQEK